MLLPSILVEKPASQFPRAFFYHPGNKNTKPGIAKQPGPIKFAYVGLLIPSWEEPGLLQAIEVNRQSRIERLPIWKAYLV